MILNMRDKSVPNPAFVVPTWVAEDDVPTWVAEDDVATRVNILFATLIVYDTGEHILYACFVTSWVYIGSHHT